MNRRDFLTAARKRTASIKDVKIIARNLATGLTPYTGSWTSAEVTHLLRRTMFGAKKADIDFFTGLSIDDAVNELLKISAYPSPPVRDYGLIVTEDGTFEDVAVMQGQTWVNDLNTTNTPESMGYIGSARIESLKEWWLGLMVNQNRNIQEKLLLFWHHHFSVQNSEIESYYTLNRYHELLRKNVMGNIRELTKKVSVEPAMLKHLNGHLNSKKAPDENYARELQELMTVGKGNDSLYTEEDVMEAARVLTGWRIDGDTMTSYLDAGSHDTGAKKFSAFYNNTTISGSTNGTQEVDQLIDMIFSTRECARFICRKLYTWFVYYAIDDATEANVIAPLAEILKNNDFEIRPVLEALFKSEHFFDHNNRSCYIKSPYDLVVGTVRELNAPFPPYTDYTNGYPLFSSLYYKAAGMQMDVFQPPDVSGWPAYYQDPIQYEVWVNSNSLPKRVKFTNELVDDDVVDVMAFVAGLPDPSNPDKVILDISNLLLGYPLSMNSRNYIRNKFLLNDTQDTIVWSDIWNSNNVAIIKPLLKNLLKFFMNLPEFQLC